MHQVSSQMNHSSSFRTPKVYQFFTPLGQFRHLKNLLNWQVDHGPLHVTELIQDSSPSSFMQQSCNTLKPVLQEPKDLHLLSASQLLQNLHKRFHILGQACDLIRISRFDSRAREINSCSYKSRLLKQCNWFEPTPCSKAPSMHQNKVLCFQICKWKSFLHKSQHNGSTYSALPMTWSKTHEEALSWTHMLTALLHHKFPLRVYWQEDDARENWHDDDDDDEVFRIGKKMVRKRIGKKMMRKENGQDDDED